MAILFKNVGFIVPTTLNYLALPSLDTEVPDEGYLDTEVPDEGYLDTEVPDEGYLDTEVPDEGYLDTEVPDEGYSRDASCALHLISTFLVHF
jgi:hypothetical protein